MTNWLYTCNEGTFNVKLLKNDGFTVTIKLLEEVPFRVGKVLYKHKIGSVLHVGHWQVREGVKP